MSVEPEDADEVEAYCRRLLAEGRLTADERGAVQANLGRALVVLSRRAEGADRVIEAIDVLLPLAEDPATPPLVAYAAVQDLAVALTLTWAKNSESAAVQEALALQEQLFGRSSEPMAAGVVAHVRSLRERFHEHAARADGDEARADEHLARAVEAGQRAIDVLPDST